MNSTPIQLPVPFQPADAHPVKISYRKNGVRLAPALFQSKQTPTRNHLFSGLIPDNQDNIYFTAPDFSDRQVSQELFTPFNELRMEELRAILKGLSRRQKTSTRVLTPPPITQ